jgi:hypothetical protein
VIRTFLALEKPFPDWQVSLEPRNRSRQTTAKEMGLPLIIL